MAKQQRTYTGAKTELKVSKGKSPTPYVHKVFDVTISDDDIISTHSDDYGRDYMRVTPIRVAKIRSVFIFSTKRKNTLSVMIVILTPMYNKKGQLIAVTNRKKVFVNPVTRKVWQYERKLSKSVESPDGWGHQEWIDEILKAVAA